MRSSLISVIIPAYNAGKYIEDTIESILTQTYDNFEIIVVNDGSTDDTVYKLNNLSKNIERLKVYTIDNGGASKARNVGLDYATGDLIYFLDADDILNVDAFRSLLKSMENNDSDLVVSTKYYKVKEKNQKKKLVELLTEEMILQNPIEYAITALIGKGRGWRTHGSLFKRHLINTYNIRYKEGITAEDFLFNLNYLQVCKKISFTKYPVENYLVRENSVSNTFSHKVFNIYIDFDKVVRSFMSQNDMTRLELYSDSFTGRNFINYIISILISNNLTYELKRKYIKEVIEKPFIINLYRDSNYILPMYSARINTLLYSIIRTTLNKKKYYFIFFMAKIFSLPKKNKR